MIAFECSSCGKPLKVKDELAGKKVKCPGCQKPVGVPQPAASISPPPAVPGEERTLPPKAPSPGEERTLPPKDRGQAAKKESLSDAGALTDLGAEKRETTQAFPATEQSAELTEFLAPPQAPDEIGRLGPYRVLKVLGHGGMGVVYLAEDPGLQRLVALKVMLPSLASMGTAKQRFLREARTAASINHDNIVHIYQVGEDRGVPFMAMQFLEGEPLDECLKRDKILPVAEVVRIGKETAEGLAAAHKRGLVHRDIKPANLWLEGEKRRIKILDFGLARAAADETHLTQTGAIVGTPQYMAPEQAEGKPVDHRSDLFSLGCLLYRMCTGEMPFKGDSTLAIISSLAMHNPKEPGKINKSVPQPLSNLIMHLLAKNPDERPQSAQEVAEALAQLTAKDTGEMPAKAGKTTLFQKPHAAASRRKWTLVGGGMLGLAVLGLVVFFLTSRERQRPENGSKQAEALPKEFTNSLGMEFVLVPKGKSWLGGGGGKPGDKEVEIKEDFYLGKYEVTQEEWEKVTGLNPSGFKAVAGVTKKDQKRFPVEMVSWDDAQTFIKRVNEKMNEAGWVYRLPKEAEWEYACRGGSLTDKVESAFDYYFEKPSNTLLPEQANFGNGKLQRICKVGSYKPNRLGLYDMHGNVYEWCEDTEKAADGSSARVHRGGSWRAGAGNCEASHHSASPQAALESGVGLRLARIPVGKEIVRVIAPPPEAQTDADRKAAELVLSLKGPGYCKVFHGDKLEEIRSGGPVTRLPSEPFALHEVYLHGVGTDEVASRLTGLKNLRLLTFYECPLTDEGVKSLRDLPELVYLNLHGTNITNAGLPSLRALPKLRDLALIETRVTDEGLLGLQQLPSLDTIMLWRTAITDKGLQNLQAVKKLVRVGVKETKVTAAGVKAFADARPNCTIEWDGGVIPGKDPEKKKSESLRPAFKNTLGMEFVLVPKGKSWLGGGGGKPGDKEVEIKEDFYLGKYEVTQEEWEKVLGARPSHFSRTGGGKDAVKDIPEAELKRFPVENISWDDAQLFLKDLNKREKQDGWVYRLPKEAEWEYACRGGLSTKYATSFDFYLEQPTNQLQPEQANFEHGKGLKRTCKVGSYQPNRLGLYDMHGNVWEWCEDRFNKEGPTRVGRGGGWGHLPVHCRAASRDWFTPSKQYSGVGLRLARVPVGKEVVKIIAPEEKKPPVETKSPPAFKNTLGMEFVLVPKGKSWLGGGAGKLGTREVEILRDFYLGKYEVTQEEWENVTGLNPSNFKEVPGITKEEQKRFPVEQVSWDDCQVFIERVNKQKDAGWVYRLPTEVEWEYACRGGPMTDKSESAFDFYFEKPINTLLPDQGTCTVGSYKPNKLGLYDMHGNVWEWCDDERKVKKRALPPVYRGGCWLGDSGHCRVAVRYAAPPSFQNNILGLRLARVPVGKESK